MLTLISAHFPIQAKQPARSVEVCQFRKLRDLQTQCAEGFAARRSLCTCKFLQLSGSCKCTQARAPSMQPGHRSRTACTSTEANTGKGRPGMGRLRLLVILSLKSQWSTAAHPHMSGRRPAVCHRLHSVKITTASMSFCTSCGTTSTEGSGIPVARIRRPHKQTQALVPWQTNSASPPTNPHDHPGYPSAGITTD